MWYKVMSKDEPKIIDTESSSKYNYLRRNIEEVEVKTGEDETTTMFEYEEAKFLKDDLGIIGYLEAYITEQVAAQDTIQADILLNQMDMLNNQTEQDGTLALILENIL